MTRAQSTAARAEASRPLECSHPMLTFSIDLNADACARLWSILDRVQSLLDHRHEPGVGGTRRRVTVRDLLDANRRVWREAVAEGREPWAALAASASVRWVWILSRSSTA